MKPAAPPVREPRNAALAGPLSALGRQRGD